MQSFQLSFHSCLMERRSSFLSVREVVKQQVRERNLRENSLLAQGLLLLSRCPKSKVHEKKNYSLTSIKRPPPEEIDTCHLKEHACLIFVRNSITGLLVGTWPLKRWTLNRNSTVSTVFNCVTYIYFLTRTLLETPDKTCASRMKRKPFDLLYTDYFGTFFLENALGPMMSHYRYRTSADPLG